MPLGAAYSVAMLHTTKQVACNVFKDLGEVCQLYDDHADTQAALGGSVLVLQSQNPLMRTEQATVAPVEHTAGAQQGPMHKAPDRPPHPR